MSEIPAKFEASDDDGDAPALNLRDVQEIDTQWLVGVANDEEVAAGGDPTCQRCGEQFKSVMTLRIHHVKKLCPNPDLSQTATTMADFAHEFKPTHDKIVNGTKRRHSNSSPLSIPQLTSSWNDSPSSTTPPSMPSSSTFRSIVFNSASNDLCPILDCGWRISPRAVGSSLTCTTCVHRVEPLYTSTALLALRLCSDHILSMACDMGSRRDQCARLADIVEKDEKVVICANCDKCGLECAFTKPSCPRHSRYSKFAPTVTLPCYVLCAIAEDARYRTPTFTQNGEAIVTRCDGCLAIGGLDVEAAKRNEASRCSKSLLVVTHRLGDQGPSAAAPKKVNAIDRIFADGKRNKMMTPLSTVPSLLPTTVNCQPPPPSIVPPSTVQCAHYNCRRYIRTSDARPKNVVANVSCVIRMKLSAHPSAADQSPLCVAHYKANRCKDAEQGVGDGESDRLRTAKCDICEAEMTFNRSNCKLHSLNPDKSTILSCDAREIFAHELLAHPITPSSTSDLKSRCDKCFLDCQRGARPKKNISVVTID